MKSKWMRTFTWASPEEHAITLADVGGDDGDVGHDRALQGAERVRGRGIGELFGDGEDRRARVLHVRPHGGDDLIDGDVVVRAVPAVVVGREREGREGEL